MTMRRCDYGLYMLSMTAWSVWSAVVVSLFQKMSGRHWLFGRIFDKISTDRIKNDQNLTEILFLFITLEAQLSCRIPNENNRKYNFAKFQSIFGFYVYIKGFINLHSKCNFAVIPMGSLSFFFISQHHYLNWDTFYCPTLPWNMKNFGTYLVTKLNLNYQISLLLPCLHPHMLNKNTFLVFR